jgi:hypothetical protein
LDQVVTANAHVKSAAVAVKVIKKLTRISISPSHLIDLTATIGEELADARDRQSAQQIAGTLKPIVKQAPETVAVGTDGGRIFTRAEEAGRGVHQPAWKETKIACLMTYSSQSSDVDPHPELPGCFADKDGVGKLVREVKSIRNESGEGTASDDNSEGQDDSETVATLLKSLVLPTETADDDIGEQQSAKMKAKAKRKKGKQDWRPQRRVRTCVSSMCNSDEFGPKVAAEARRRNFFQAARRAFLGDGLAWNWTLQSRWFPDFVPILDFVHPTTYIYEASRVVADGEEQAWPLCVCWLQACWEGRVSSVLAELRNWQATHPTAPDEKLAENDGRAIVARAVTYLSNNACRMDYGRYRRMGLPVTSSMVESLIKEFNYRVKGSEKSWKRPSGCESILQIRNAVLCDDADRLSDFILSRPGSPYYRPSTAKRASEATAVAA